MDTKELVKKLHQVFCEINHKDKKYSKVWLADVDFGGMYYNGMYVLNVKAEHQIESCSEEIGNILDILDREAKEELKLIWSVSVYNANEQIHCESEDIMVYTEEDACS